MRKYLNEDNFRKKYLIVDKFFKMTYIKDKKKLLKSDLYIGLDGIFKKMIEPLSKRYFLYVGFNKM